MNKVILVTGGVGFVGNAFCKLILKERPDWKVINVDLCTYVTNLKTIEEELKNPNYMFLKADIRDRDAIFEIFRKALPDYVVNFAAESHVDRSLKDPKLFLDTNVTGTRILLEASLKYGVERFHQVSTDEVYGDFPLENKRSAFDEKAELRPSSPYAISKATADLLALHFYHNNGLPVTISRAANTYGPYQFPEKLIPLTIYRAMLRQSIPLYGDGSNIRDWIHVEDHARGILAILEKGKPGQVYNLGAKSEISNLNLVKQIIGYMKKPESLITFVKDRPEHDLRYGVSAQKVKALGWKPTVKFKDGLISTIKWYIKNSDWLGGCLNEEYLSWLKDNYENREP